MNTQSSPLLLTYEDFPDDLMEILCGFNETEVLQIKAAYLMSVRAHAGQQRKSGEAYMVHIRDVLKQLNIHSKVLNENTTSEDIIVALLHDVLEDHPSHFSTILQDFGYAILVRILGLSKPSKVLFELWSQLNHESDDEGQVLLYSFWKTYYENMDNMDLISKTQELQRIIFNHYQDSEENQNKVLMSIIARSTAYTRQVNGIVHTYPNEDKEKLLQKRYQEFAAELQLLLNSRANVRIKIADKSSNLKDTVFHERASSYVERKAAKRKSRSILQSISTYRIAVEIHGLKKLLPYFEANVHNFHASLALHLHDD